MAWCKNELLNAEKRRTNDGRGGVNFSAATNAGRGGKPFQLCKRRLFFEQKEPLSSLIAMLS